METWSFKDEDGEAARVNAMDGHPSTATAIACINNFDIGTIPDRVITINADKKGAARTVTALSNDDPETRFSPSGRRAVFSSGYGTLRFFSTDRNGSLTATGSISVKGMPTDMAFSQDDSFVAVALAHPMQNTGELVIADMDKDVIASRKYPSFALGVDIDAQNNILAGTDMQGPGTMNGILEMFSFDKNTGKLKKRASQELRASIKAVRFAAPNQAILALSGDDYRIAVCRIMT